MKKQEEERGIKVDYHKLKEEYNETLEQYVEYCVREYD